MLSRHPLLVLDDFAQLLLGGGGYRCRRRAMDSFWLEMRSSCLRAGLVQRFVLHVAQQIVGCHARERSPRSRKRAPRPPGTSPWRPRPADLEAIGALVVSGRFELKQLVVGPNGVLEHQRLGFWSTLRML